MDTILYNLSCIFMSLELTMALVGSAILGLSCFFTALHLTCKKDLPSRCFKYLITTCSISFTSSFFIILLNPELFSKIDSSFILSNSLLFIAVWITSSEIAHSLTAYKNKNYNSNRDKIYHNK